MKKSDIKEAFVTVKQVPLMTFEETKEFIKIIVVIFLPTVGIWYTHFKSLELPKLTNYDVAISTFLFSPVILGLICFYLYGLLFTDNTNKKILKGISYVSSLILRAWPLFLLFALLLAIIEKNYPTGSIDKLKALFISLISLVIFMASATVLRIILYSKSIIAQMSFLMEISVVTLYFFVFGFVMIFLILIVPKI